MGRRKRPPFITHHSSFIIFSGGRMDFELNEEQQQVKSSVREFAEGEIAPHVREWDEAQHFPVELLPKLAEQGLMGVIFPEEYGGGGTGLIGIVALNQERSPPGG